ncbi:MAG: hypothetical protein AAGD10_02830 [Myxococcota bacterium]
MRYSHALRARLTRERLAALLGTTQARVRGHAPNEGYERVEAALENAARLARHQDGLVDALRRARPEDDDEALVERLDARARAGKRAVAATVARSAEAAWLAWALWIDEGAGWASGESSSLLDTEEGTALLEEGLERACAHGAKQLLRR